MERFICLVPPDGVGQAFCSRGSNSSSIRHPGEGNNLEGPRRANAARAAHLEPPRGTRRWIPAPLLSESCRPLTSAHLSCAVEQSRHGSAPSQQGQGRDAERCGLGHPIATSRGAQGGWKITQRARRVSASARGRSVDAGPSTTRPKDRQGVVAFAGVLPLSRSTSRRSAARPNTVWGERHMYASDDNGEVTFCALESAHPLPGGPSPFASVDRDRAGVGRRSYGTG